MLWKDVRRTINECDVCQHNKIETLHHLGLLQTLLDLSQIWKDISMNLVEGLPILGKRAPFW